MWGVQGFWHKIEPPRTLAAPLRDNSLYFLVHVLDKQHLFLISVVFKEFQEYI